MPFPLNEILVTCQPQATASNLPFYDISVPQNSSFEVSDDAIVFDLWFGLPDQKSWLRLCTDTRLGKK